ncbi:hypothetical protein [Herbiconiux sp.]|nr:hypothetical protein [Herbiconiux sp.]
MHVALKTSRPARLARILIGLGLASAVLVPIGFTAAPAQAAQAESAAA